MSLYIDAHAIKKTPDTRNGVRKMLVERCQPFVFGTLLELLGAGAGMVTNVDGAQECWQFVCAFRFSICAMQKM